MMFNEPSGNTEKDRSRLIMIVSGVAVLVVIGLIILVGSRGPAEATRVDLAKPGSEEFDSYAPHVVIANIDRSTAERLNNKIGIIRCRVRNTGDKTLVALQLRGAAIGFNDDVLKETIITPIPRFHESLGPNQSIPIELVLEPIPDPMNVADMTIEVVGLKVK
ncbi:MAG TPA: hypothetical protein VNO70_13175 [Blastocatellia bacterium]|nr:hypothetical protein [Blastocatellia bacterium]